MSHFNTAKCWNIFVLKHYLQFGCHVININIYDNNVVVRKGFSFGYYCWSWSAAHAFYGCHSLAISKTAVEAKKAYAAYHGKRSYVLQDTFQNRCKPYWENSLTRHKEPDPCHCTLQNRYDYGTDSASGETACDRGSSDDIRVLWPLLYDGRAELALELVS